MIKVGEYIRTPWGEIGKITDIPKHNKYFDDGFSINGEFHTCGRLAMKELESTPNIIDLIEVGDLVILASPYCEQNIYKVVNAFKGKHSSIELDCFGDGTMSIDEPKEIKSIVTREQFESMKYEVK